MEGVIIQAAQLILSLSILVILHEFGHFLPARLFGIRVEKFYLFFNPKFSLFKFKKGETEYGVGWLPLGGYVKLSGMMDESMDKEQLKEEPKPWEFRSKPAWQRLIVMVGGVVVNLLLGMFIYAMILFTWGQQYLPAKNAKFGVHVAEVAEEVGFKDGDMISKINGESFPDNYSYPFIQKELLLNDEIKNVTVVNNGVERVVNIPGDFAQRVVGSGTKGIFFERVPFVIDTVLAGTPASKAGFKRGDKIVKIDGADANYFYDFVKGVKDKAGKEVKVGVLRDGVEMTLPVTVAEDGKIGVGNTSPTVYFDYVTKEYSLGASIPAGVNYAIDRIKDYVSQFGLVFTKEGASQIGGFGAIGSMFTKAWNWHNFWNMTAFISLILAFMNILPIPALDGGHVMFLLYEMISGRKPGDKFMEYAQITGFVILMSLMVFANGNDIFKLFTD